MEKGQVYHMAAPLYSREVKSQASRLFVIKSPMHSPCDRRQPLSLFVPQSPQQKCILNGIKLVNMCTGFILVVSGF